MKTKAELIDIIKSLPSSGTQLENMDEAIVVTLAIIAEALIDIRDQLEWANKH